MSANDVIALIDALVWPVVILIVVALFRRQLDTLIRRIREFEGPADLKISLINEQEVEEIVREANVRNEPPASVARRIVDRLDKRQTRIVRALFDDRGRAIYNYQSAYYNDALEELIRRGYVEKLDRGYGLTAEGEKFATEYLPAAIERTESRATSLSVQTRKLYRMGQSPNQAVECASAYGRRRTAKPRRALSAAHRCC